MLIIKKIIFTSLLMLLFNCNTNSTEPQTTAKDPLEDKCAGWLLPMESTGFLKFIEGDYKVSRYWELPCGGEKVKYYSIIRTPEELDAFWNKELKEVRIKGKVLEKPVIDFNKNLLIMIMPGHCHCRIGYKVIVSESSDSIKLHMSNYVIGKPSSMIGIDPVFCFEIPIPPKSKPISVDFDVECQSSFPK